MCVIPEDLLVRIADRLKVLGDPSRLKIVHLLEEGELCVGEIVEQMESSQANVSKHLATLRKAGLVRSRRAGMNVCYSIEDPVVFAICRLICGFLEREASEVRAEIAEIDRGGESLSRSTA